MAILWSKHAACDFGLKDMLDINDTHSLFDVFLVRQRLIHRTRLFRQQQLISMFISENV